jgi:hypothetical protein
LPALLPSTSKQINGADVKFSAVLLAGLCVALPAHAQNPVAISYKSVAEAYDALRANPKAVMRQEADGWIVAVVENGPDEGLWSFTPRGNPAFPAVIKRKVVESNGNIYVAMDVICQSKKEPCDALVADFTQLNQQMAQELNKKKPR